MKKNFLDIYTSLIISAVLVLVIFICYDFQFEIFSDRDLIRSQNLINSFEVYGADFGMQNGRRVPGGFNYYFLYLLINISSNILILNYIILSITLISFFFLLITNIKWLGTHGVIFSFIFFITSSTFILQIKQFWNPTLGLPFIILAFTFYLNFLNKQKKSFLFFAFTFVFLATQFHVSYSVFGFIFIILTIYYKLIDFLKLTFVFVISLIFTYFPLILNYFYPLINFDLNDYYLINSIKIEEIENNNVLFWIVRKIFLQLGSISNLIIEKKYFSAIFFLFLILFFKLALVIKTTSLYKNNKKYFIHLILILTLILQILFIDNILREQFIYFFPLNCMLIFSTYIISNDNISKKIYFNNNHEYIKILIIIFLLIVAISSITYSFTYGYLTWNIGKPNRYNLVILPLYSLIAGYSLSVIYNWSKKKNFLLKKLTIFFITILITFKFIFFSYSHIYKSKNDFKNAYNFKVEIIDTLAQNFNLSKKDFFTKVAIGFIDDNMNVKKLNKSNFEFYINNSIKDNESTTYNDCILVLMDNKTNSFHNSNIDYFLKNLSNNENLFGSKINIYQNLKFDDFLVIKYKPQKGDCAKSLLNDYIITKKEKEALKFLLGKEDNKFYSKKKENIDNYYLKIMDKGMKYPVDIFFEFNKKNDSLKINIHSNRLRNNDTFLNGYWDSTNLTNPTIEFEEKNLKNVYVIQILKGVLGKNFLKTPWTIKSSYIPKGNYTVRFKADKLEEKFNKNKIENVNYLVDDNFVYN